MEKHTISDLHQIQAMPGGGLMENDTDKIGMTLGSLFDGSGGFPLGGLISGITPVWASEIEPFPVRVTTKRLPFIKHYSDVSKLDGRDMEPVDIITFGSPCQDMSIAGKREGLDGNRSGLFYQAIRIIREMREKTNGEKPRYIVWENVPGAFSSNKGEDFRCVLESICRIADKTVSVPPVNKWAGAGHIMGTGFSVAWRTLDAQYWGVPQRRKRIYLVADFAGGSAGKILFESEGVSGYSAEGFRAWQGTASPSCRGAQKAGGTDAGIGTGAFLYKQGAASRSVGFEEEKSPTLSTGANHPPLVFENHSQDSRYTASKAWFFMSAREKVADPLVATDYKDPPLITDKDGADYIVRRLTPTECARLQGFPDWWCNDLGTEKPTDEEMYFWYQVFETYRDVTNPGGKMKTSNQIRKWLQDPASDSAEYKMWGNGVALPCVVFVLSGIVYYAQKSGS